MMGKRKEAKSPPRQGVVYWRNASVFIADVVASELIRTVGKQPQRSATWIAEALNDATTDYFTAFALARTAGAYEQEQWIRELRIAAETCLQMLAPGLVDGERPRTADHRVHSALFHWGEPVGIEFVAGPADAFGYDPVRDALDAIPGKLWDLRRMAEYAEAQWRLARTPRGKRHQVDRAILSWVLRLADIYRRVFGIAAPEFPKPDSPFVKFADAARKIVLNAMVVELPNIACKIAPDDVVTAHGTDKDAFGRLSKFGPTRLTSFVRQHRSELSEGLEIARNTDYVPVRIRNGELSEADDGDAPISKQIQPPNKS